MSFDDLSSVSFEDLWWADWFVLGYYILLPILLWPAPSYLVYRLFATASPGVKHG
jgi:hypothetical protein